MAIVRIVLLLVCACGRFGFEDRSAPGDGNGVDGAVIAAPRSLAASFSRTCAVLGDGTLWCWGKAETTIDVFAPKQIGTDTDWVQVATADARSCARKDNGTLWCWGVNTSGRLGDGTMLPREAPVQIGAETDWSHVAVTGYSTCGLRGGALWCWGENTEGAVGDGTMTRQTSPVAIQAGRTFSKIATGPTHVCAIESGTNALWCWGANVSGQLGTGSTASVATAMQIGTAAWRDIAANQGMTCGIQMDNSIWCAGSTYGPLFELVYSGDWQSLIVGIQYACGLTSDDRLLCWGQNGMGQLGTADNVVRSSPFPVEPASRWSMMVSGGEHTCGVRDGTLACTGNGARGQLGDGIVRWAGSRDVAGGPWQQTDLGGFFACSIASDKTVWCWGHNFNAPLTGEYSEHACAPRRIGSFVDGKLLGSANQGVLLVREDGTLWRWGVQWGNTNTSGSVYMQPIQVGSATNWIATDGGDYHDCALQSDNSLWCWGGNGDGQVGDNSTTPSTMPFKIGTASYLLASVGGATSCAIRTDKSLWCWGKNTSGQVGDGTTTMRRAPQEIANGTAWSTVTVGQSHACGIRTDGTLWCWGARAFVGDGGVADRTAPVQIGAATNWSVVSAHNNHTCATRGDGSLWCWGSNFEGQLGDGTRTAQSVPVQVGPATLWASVAVGPLVTCATTQAGVTRCWGETDRGVLGDGLAWITSYRPVVR